MIAAFIMEHIVERLRSLDDLELRTELSKHGEKTGPITPTTRRVIEKRLAKRIFAMEHPGYDVDEDCATAKRESPTNTSDIKLDAFELQSTESCQGGSPGDQRQISAGNQTQPACFYVVSSVPSNEKETGEGEIRLIFLNGITNYNQIFCDLLFFVWFCFSF